MSASISPFVLQGTLSYPPDVNQQPVGIPFGANGTYTTLLDARLVMVGAGTEVVPFGTVAGAKVLLIEYEVTTGAVAVQVNVNGGTDDIELSPGGFWAYSNPIPVVGITALSIVRTADAVIRVRLLG